MKTEYGADKKQIAKALTQAAKALKGIRDSIRRLPDDPALAKREPENLASIRALRPQGPRRMWTQFNTQAYRPRLKGALLGRLAGCTLGAPVEFWGIDGMQSLAEENGQAFPPDDYWIRVPNPKQTRYRVSRREEYTRDGMNGVPVDDDIIYTLLGLLIAEEYGPSFSVEDVGRAWLKYLPYAATAEAAALEHLKNGVPAHLIGGKNNPWCEWIGADIRADPWGYIAPGLPERAADMAWRDAWLSHRRQAVYGSMFFAAAISAAFCVDTPLEALRIGLSEIPRQCALARAIRWALKTAPSIPDYQAARDAIDERFAGMNRLHTINNACLTVFGIAIGGRDLSRVIGETVAMGLDNDCNAATAGSIVGAIIGGDAIPAHWHKNFHNTIHSYLNGKKTFTITGLLRRFEKQAKTVWMTHPA